MAVFLKWIFVFLNIQQIAGSRAGNTHCSGTSYPASITGSGAAASSGTSYLMQDPSYQLQCCGVIDAVRFSGSPGSVTLQIWRQDDDNNFELVSFGKSAYALSSSPFLPDDFEKVSFREGDVFGWTGGSVQKTASGSKYLNWYSSSVSVTAVGDTHVWYGEAIDSGQEYQIQVRTAQSTAPYFRNLPTTLQYADTEVLVSGITLLNLTWNDLDPDDAADLTVTLSPAWNDMFELTTGTTPNLIKTKESLGPGTYKPTFLIEEGHCGVSATSTLTVTVTDSEPSIDNLPGAATVHEDDLDETLLYTVTMSDPLDQAMWCQGDWTIGTPNAGNTPFIVKMLSTTGGRSEAGIYLIEDPKLDYDVAPTYDLTVKCEDTYGHEVTGNFYVNVIENQKPLFYNLGNMVEVDATVDGTGTTAFVISSTDRDGDQITYTYTCTCNPAGTCPLELYDSGAVMVTDNLLSWTTNKCTLTVTANDLRDSSVVDRDLIVYIANINNDPTFSNVNGNSVTVSENEALGLSLYQMSARDTDTADTLVYYMAIDDQQGYDILEFSSSGELTTHSTYSINYELFTTHTFTLTVYVNDAKVQYSETFTVTVTDENEAPAFLSPEYFVFQDEGASGAFTDDPSILALDVDAGDTLTYTRDCGTYDSYINMDTGDATLDFSQEYDLDDTILGLPIFIRCTVYVHDSGSLNDSTTLYINVNYINDETPVFNPSTYTIDVNSDTPSGYAVLQLTATDRDIGEDTDLEYTLDQSSLGGTYFVVGSNGRIYANQLLNPLKSAGTRTVTVTVTDAGGLTDTATVTMTFVDVTFIPSITTDRNWYFIDCLPVGNTMPWPSSTGCPKRKYTVSVSIYQTSSFYYLNKNLHMYRQKMKYHCSVTWPAPSPDQNHCEFFLWGYVKSLVYSTKPTDTSMLTRNIKREEDPTNVTWLTTSVITIVTCLGIILCTIIVYCMKRTTPCIDFNKLFKKKPKRELDNKRRKMPFGRQGMPTYRHIHSNEVLRNSPVQIASPAPVDHDSLRPGSGTSGRVTITEVRMNEEERSWMDGYATPEVASGPIKSVTRPRYEDWEYMNPARSIPHTGTVLSEEEMYGTPLSPETRSLSKLRRKTPQRLTTATHVLASPSPTPGYHDDDDFRSERISIATPASYLSREPTPTF